MSAVTEKADDDAVMKAWWGEYSLKRGRWFRWQIGPKTLYARTLDNEWRFGWTSTDDMLSEAIEFGAAGEDLPDDPALQFRRFAVRDPGTKLVLTPRLADRPVIVRPETPLFLPPGQDATLYVSTVVWLAAKPAKEGAPELLELPMYRASDTWFGPDTMNGELCYSSVTSARTEIRMLAQVPHRAFTPVNISNRGSDALEIEWLRVPVNQLSLFVGKRGRLWTDKITFERDAGEDSASLRITEHEELSSKSSQRLSGPREPRPSGLVHTFSRIFGKSEL